LRGNPRKKIRHSQFEKKIVNSEGEKGVELDQFLLSDIFHTFNWGYFLNKDRDNVHLSNWR